MVLEHFFGYLMGKRHGAKMAIRELEISLRAKDPATPVEDTKLYSTIMKANVVFLLNFVASGTLVWFATRKAPKFFGTPPLPKSLSFIYSWGCGSIFGDMRHYEFYHGSATDVLEGGEERMKMELAKIILNNHSTDNSLVEVVKRQFIAENLLSDQHQEQQLFKWRQRNSYMDYTFMERMKESEANNSENADEAESSVNTRILEEDSLACILGAPGDNTEISTVLTRRELQLHRKSHRHRRQRHADKTAVL